MERIIKIDENNTIYNSGIAYIETDKNKYKIKIIPDYHNKKYNLSIEKNIAGSAEAIRKYIYVSLDLLSISKYVSGLLRFNTRFNKTIVNLFI